MGRRPKKLDLDEARRLYESGLNLRQVSAQVGVSPALLSARLRASGVTISRRPRRLVDDEHIVELRRQGLTWTQIGAEVGMSYAGVRRRFNALPDPPVLPRRQPGRSRATEDQVLEVISWGATQRQAAAMLGISTATVSAKLRRARRGINQ